METIENPDSPVNSENEYLTASSWIKNLRFCGDHLLRITKELLEVSLNAENPRELTASKAQSSIFLANILAKRMESTSIKMTGQWETILWNMVELAKHWRPEQNLEFEILRPTCFKSWILRMFTDPRLCPNRFLRLEMLRFIGMWPETYLQDATSGMQAAAGLVASSAYMELDDLMGDGSRMSLFYPLVKVLNSLHKYGYLVAVTAAAVDQVKSLTIGPEVIFFSSLIELLSQKAEATGERYLASSVDFSVSAVLFRLVLYCFKLLIVEPPTMTAFQCPGLAQAAAASLVTIASSVVALLARLKIVDYSNYLSLAIGLDDIFQIISTQEKCKSIWRVLQLDHAQVLSNLNKQTVDSGFIFHICPKPSEESTEECPEKFMDSLTQSVMEAPVLLHSSKMVVDESTLVHLLLVSPSDPFTRCPLDHGSYSRLPDLQADILAWNNTMRGNHYIEDLGSNIDSVKDTNGVVGSSNGGSDSSNGGSDSSNGGSDSSNGGSDSSNGGSDSSNGGSDSIDTNFERIFVEYNGDSDEESNCCDICEIQLSVRLKLLSLV